MYPAIGFGTIDDLPDTITSSAETLSKLADAIEFALPDGSGNFTMYYGTYASPLESEGVGLFNNQWAFKVDGGSPAGVRRDCLINEICFSEQDPDWFCDNFADSYTIEAPNSFPTTVTRVSLCLWEGVDICGNKAYLSYGDTGGTPYPVADNIWAASIEYYNDLVCEGADGLTINEKDGPNNTPVGTYSSVPGQPAQQTITVS